MAAKTGSVWAIDVGNSTLKALRVSTERGVLEVLGFENIRHGKNLSGSGVTDAEREELVALSLRKFVNRYDLLEDEVVVSVPSQNSFARFVKLPPVDKKRIPEIVKFEAVQQIPFDINDIQWDWQRMSEEDSSELKVGIFAIKNEVVDSMLEHFDREDIQVGYVQMAPMALYNYALYDRRELFGSDGQATVVLNIGAESTDLVVCTQSSVWQRCILIGGNTFTKAIAETFKLSFEKAEKLKRTAPMSKYARQIFQAMRPVFTDLVSEIQRSLGFYSSSNANTKIVRVIALGGGTKMRGLLKYLQQTLQLPVERPDSYKRLAIGAGVSKAKFHENVSDFGVVYGLALQALELAAIESNLLPRRIARSMEWASKGRWFIGAACLLLVVSLMCLARAGWDTLRHTKNQPVRTMTSRILQSARQAKQKVEDEERKGSEYTAAIDKELKAFDYREVVPLVHEIILSVLPNEKNNPEQAELYRAFAAGDVAGVRAIPRKQRKQLFLTAISINFAQDLSSAGFSSAELWRRNRGRGGGEEEEMMEFDEYEYELMMQAMRSGRQYDPSMRMTMGMGQEKTDAGFVVTVVGYSPYEIPGDLIDPPGVENRPDAWGMVTRLGHLDDIPEFAVDGNCPFSLYEKTQTPEHFKLEISDVNLSDEIPKGVGIDEPLPGVAQGTGSRQGNRQEWVLVDPMTREIISSMPKVDETGKPIYFRSRPVYQINDHWFVLNFKLLWKDAPEPAVQAAPAYANQGSLTPRSSTSGGTTRTPSRPTSRRQTPNLDW